MIRDLEIVAIGHIILTGVIPLQLLFLLYQDRNWVRNVLKLVNVVDPESKGLGSLLFMFSFYPTYGF